MTKNIMIVGVGGQGTLLTSRILGGVFEDAGYKVKVSEVHGMAQRGGSVVTFVRYGESVAEPIVEEGQADVLIAFERLEALRYANFLKKDGVLICNDWRIDPISVVMGTREYPDNIIEDLSKEYTVYSINAMEEALEAGQFQGLQQRSARHGRKAHGISQRSLAQGDRREGPAQNRRDQFQSLPGRLRSLKNEEGSHAAPVSRRGMAPFCTFKEHKERKMKILISVKGASGKKPPDQPDLFEYPEGPMRVRDFLEETVRSCVRRFNERKEAGEVLRLFSREALEDMAAGGKVSFGDLCRKKSGRGKGRRCGPAGL